ncbi:MAG: hypothetical protein KIT83_04500 [Bryobacterales bacterium]|nr:hypothetical protein [Bryobacterales bacterium]
MARIAAQPQILLIFLLCLGIAFPTHFALSAEVNSRPPGLHHSGPHSLFEENRGQAPIQYSHILRGAGFSVGFAEDGVRIALARPEGDPSTDVLWFSWEGAATVRPEGEAPVATRTHYLNRASAGVALLPTNASHLTAIPNFQKVRYRNAYPGTDIVFYLNNGDLEFDIEFAPYARLSAPTLSMAGASHLTTNATGDLLIHLGDRVLRQRAPHSFQLVNGVRNVVASRYELIGEHRVAVALDSHSAALPLTVDPILEFATYFGGSGTDELIDAQLDATGAVYLAGVRMSPQLPGDGGVTAGINGPMGLYFVSKLSADLSTVEFTTYVDTPGNWQGIWPQFAVAPDGSIYLSYRSRNSVSSLQPTAGPYFFPQGSSDIGLEKSVILSIAPTGDALRYRTVFGCQQNILPLMHATNSGLLLGGATGCTGFPVSPGAFTNNPVPSLSRAQIVLGRLSLDGQTMPFSTVIGGNGSQSLNVLHQDPTGHLWLGGSTTSPDFPVSPGAYGTVANTNADGFLMRLAPDGTAVQASTRLGGDGAEHVRYLGLGADGSVYALVLNVLPDFPTTPDSFQPNLGTPPASAVVHMDRELRTLRWSTFYPENYGVVDFRVGTTGEVGILTRSTSGALPLSQDALLRRVSDHQNNHIGLLSSDGGKLKFGSRYFGRWQSIGGRILRLDAATMTLAAGSFLQGGAPPATGTLLTTGQTGAPRGIYLARVSLANSTVCSVRLTPPTQTIGSEVTEATINVDAPAGCPWMVPLPQWAPIGLAIPEGAGIGSGTVKLTFPRSNISTDETRINVRADDQEAIIIQEPASCSRKSVSPAILQFPAEGGLLNARFDIPGNCEWYYQGPSSMWLRLATNNGQPIPSANMHGLDIRAEVSANSFEARETSFTIGDLTVPVRQAGGACTSTVSPAFVQLPVGGGTATFTVNTSQPSCGWQAIASDSLAILGSPGVSGNAAIQVSMETNPTNIQRIGRLYVAGKTVEVRQAPNACDATVRPLRAYLPPNRGSIAVNIQASGPGCGWQPEFSQPWLQFYSGSTSGGGTLYVSVQENKTGAKRTGSISILGETIEVVQYATETREVRFSAGTDNRFLIDGAAGTIFQVLYLPEGETFTVSAEEFVAARDGVVLQNLGWDNSNLLTRTYTVGKENLSLVLRSRHYTRVRRVVEGNSPGDGSRIDIRNSKTPQPTDTLNRPDGTYYLASVDFLVEAVVGTQSTFQRWEGDFSHYTNRLNFTYNFGMPAEVRAVFAATGGTPPLQYSPARLLLRYGSGQDLPSALAVITASSPRQVTAGGASCQGIGLPFTTSVETSNTPATVQVTLERHWAALLSPGTYACEAVFGVVGNPAITLTIPVDVEIAEPAVAPGAVRVAAVVEGAAFRRVLPAPGIIMSLFGERLASGTAMADRIPLPTTLGDLRVELYHEETSASQDAPLFYVSPLQVNFLVPGGFPQGPMQIRVRRTGFGPAVFPSFVQSHQPSLFSANSDGKGAPAGEFLRVNSANGQRVNGPLATCTGGAGSCLPQTLQFGSAQETLYLIFYGTGFSALGSTANVRIGGEPVPVEYTGPQGSFVGLDQINVRVPRSFAGRGVVTVEVELGGLSANSLQVRF